MQNRPPFVFEVLEMGIMLGAWVMIFLSLVRVLWNVSGLGRFDLQYFYVSGLGRFNLQYFPSKWCAANLEANPRYFVPKWKIRHDQCVSFCNFLSSDIWCVQTFVTVL